MQNHQIQRTAVATAVSAVLMAGMGGAAYALDIEGSSNAFPKNDGEFFIGAPVTRIQYTATGSNEFAVTAKINYFAADDSPLGASVSETDVDQGTGIRINISVGAPATTDYGVVTVSTGGSSDDIGGFGSTFGYVTTAGDLVGDDGAAAFTTEAEAITAAMGDPLGRIPHDPSYTGINVIDARVDVAGASNAIVFATFNADPTDVSGNAFGGAAIGPDELVILEGGVPSLNQDKTISDGTAGTPGEPLASNQLAFISATQGVGVDRATAKANPFDVALTSAETGGGLNDGANNGPTIVNVFSPLAELDDPDYANDGGQNAIAEGTADDLYDGGTTTIDISVRMNDQVDGTTWNATDDVVVSNDAGEITGTGAFSDSTDADGRSILELTVTAAGDNEFYIDPTNGNLIYGETRDEATPVTVQIVPGATEVALSFDPDASVSEPLTEEQVVAGVVQMPKLTTKDANEDGAIDGGTLDFRQPTAGLVSGELSLSSYQEDLGEDAIVGPPAVPAVPPKFVLLDTLVAPDVNDTEAMLVLVSPDAPTLEGAAPASTTNDYNARDGANEDDAALIIPDNVGTQAKTSLPDMFLGGGVPMRALVGSYDADDALETSMEYLFAWDADTGLPLPVMPGAVGYSMDGAAPVLQSVVWASANDEDEPSLGTVAAQFSEAIRPRSGDPMTCEPPVVVIADPENDAINELRFGPLPGGTPARTPDLLNSEAGFDDQVMITIAPMGEPNVVLLENVPNVVGELASLGDTGMVEDLQCLPAFATDNVDINTVGEPNKLLFMTAIDVLEVDGLHNAINVTFSGPVASPDGQEASDRIGMFQVRANVGFAAAEGTDEPAEPNEVFQFIVAGGNVLFPGDIGHLGGDDQVTLLLTDPLPGATAESKRGTVNVWVDYQGVSSEAVEEGSLSYVAGVKADPLDPAIVAQNDDDKQFDDDELDELMMPIPSRNVPIDYTLTGLDIDDGYGGDPDGFFDDAGEFGPTADDVDTQSQNFDQPLPAFVGLGTYEESQRNLITQRVSGSLDYDGVPLFEDTPVRADLVILYTDSGEQQYERKAVVGNGFIEVRQGNQSEFSDEGPSEANNDSDTNNWVNMALLNSALKSNDFDNFAKDKQAVCDAEDALDSAEANNKDSNTIDNLRKKLADAENSFDRKYLGNDSVDCYGEPHASDRYIMAYVEVTKGDGGKAQDGGSALSNPVHGTNNALANGNAAFGSTATLTKNLPNRQKNGTSYYPVQVFMEYGSIEDSFRSSESREDTRNVRDGQLALVKPILGAKAEPSTYFKVVDTAYALVDDEGGYKVTVGMDTNAFNAKSPSDLSNILEYDGGCILLKVKNTVRASRDAQTWTQINSCDSSFTSYLPFEGDLNRNGTATTLSADLHDISNSLLNDDGDWEIVPIAGTMARDNSGPLDLPKFFLQTRPSDGATVTIWAHDGHSGGFNDAVATLGLNQGKEPAVQLAFELGDKNDNTTVGEINPKPGAALAFQGDRKKYYYQSTNAGSGNDVKGLLDNSSYGEHRLFVPVSGPQGTPLGADAWHLVTFDAEDMMLDDIVGAYPAIDAMIIFHQPVNDTYSGRDDNGDDNLDGDVDTFTWFRGETPPTSIFGRPIGAFIHVDAEVPAFNITP